MKIESMPGFRPATGATPSAQSPTTGAESFQQMLSKTIGDAAPTTAPVMAPSVPCRGLACDTSLSSQPAQEAYRRVDGYLDLLSRYQQQLADPSVTLRAMQPTVQRLEDERQTVSQALDALPEASGLKNIGSQGLILGSLEALRFNAGEYITD